MFDKVKQFLGDVALEFRRIAWPARRDLVDSSIVVIVFIILLAIVIMFCDEFIRMMLKWILGSN